jgi:hypothetical protein
MDVFLAIVVVLVVALIATSARLYRLRRTRAMSLIFSGGWPALIAGVALGPEVSGLIKADTILSATPLLIAALGWVGLMVGLQGRRELLAKLPRGIGLTVAADCVVSSALTGAVAIVGLGLWTSWSRPWPDYVEPVALLIACSTGWAMETRSMSSLSSRASQRVALLVRLTGGLAAMVAIAQFGIVEKLVARGTDGALTVDLIGGCTGLAVTIALACLAGVLGKFAIRLAGRSAGEQLTVFLGLVAVVGGIAAELGFSPLLAAMATGIVIANISSPDLLQFERFIIKAEQIIAFLVFALAGLLMRVWIGWGEIGLVVGLIAARIAIKPLLLQWGARRVQVEEAAGDGQSPIFEVGAMRFSPIRQSAVAAPIALALTLIEPSDFNRRLISVVALTGLVAALCTVALAAWSARPRPRAEASTSPSMEAAG